MRSRAGNGGASGLRGAGDGGAGNGRAGDGRTRHSPRLLFSDHRKWFPGFGSWFRTELETVPIDLGFVKPEHLFFNRSGNRIGARNNASRLCLHAFPLCTRFFGLVFKTNEGTGF